MNDSIEINNINDINTLLETESKRVKVNHGLN